MHREFQEQDTVCKISHFLKDISQDCCFSHFAKGFFGSDMEVILKDYTKNVGFLIPYC